MPDKIIIKDSKIKEIIKNGGKNGAKKDFFELIRRAAKVKK